MRGGKGRAAHFSRWPAPMDEPPEEVEAGPFLQANGLVRSGNTRRMRGGKDEAPPRWPAPEIPFRRSRGRPLFSEIGDGMHRLTPERRRKAKGILDKHNRRVCSEAFGDLDTSTLEAELVRCWNLDPGQLNGIMDDMVHNHPEYRQLAVRYTQEGKRICSAWPRRRTRTAASAIPPRSKSGRWSFTAASRFSQIAAEVGASRGVVRRWMKEAEKKAELGEACENPERV